jgi:hypothetical protein
MLFVSFVPISVSVDALEEAFDGTFGTTTMVRFGPEKTNQYGNRYKTAHVEVLGNTEQMRHFICQIEKYGNNSFTAGNTTYKVQMDTSDRQVSQVVHGFVPRIV